MKTIKFDKLHTKKRYIITGIGLFTLFVFYFTFKDSVHLWVFNLITSFAAVILISRPFWYEAYVQYTKQRISIRINNTSQVGINFDDLMNIENARTKLILSTKSKTHTIDVEDVNPKDVQKLVDLLVDRSEAFYRDSTNIKYYD